MLLSLFPSPNLTEILLEVRKRWGKEIDEISVIFSNMKDHTLPIHTIIEKEGLRTRFPHMGLGPCDVIITNCVGSADLRVQPYPGRTAQDHLSPTGQHATTTPAPTREPGSYAF